MHVRLGRLTPSSRCDLVISYLNWVQVGAHDDLVQRTGQFGRQLRLLLQTLESGVVVEPGT